MSAPPAGGFSLFPNPSNDPRPRERSQSRTRAATPQEGLTSVVDATPPRAGRQTPVRRNSATRDGRQRVVSNNPWQHALDARKQQQLPEATAGPSTIGLAITEDPVIETAYVQPVTDAPQRCDTAFSEAQTLVRSPSQRSRSSIAKPPIAYTTAGPSTQPGDAAGQPAVIRSMFPRYNPEIPLARQDYYPTQTSPTHIPQSAISRPLYSAPQIDAAAVAGTPTGPAGAQGPSSAQPGNTQFRWPPARPREPAIMPPVTTTEELRNLWKVANGWRASSAEGRNYCLKLSASTDALPSYTLSSSTNQPFYCLRVDPTSASALQPPPPNTKNTGKKSSPPPSPPSLPSSTPEPNQNQETSDGLLAHLWPTPAARLVADRANDLTTVALAQQESARLVWDADSGAHFLAHPALAVPFCVAIERTPAFGRVEYTLEHLESPGWGRREDRKQKRNQKKKKMEQFEIDLESQDSDLKKGRREEDELPWVLRALVGLITGSFKCVVWCITLAFKALLGILSVFTKCCGLGKL
ncbi:hypothetical protein N0V88_004628 [Collariella sp. IMI 366227]|nr:hypothetical protein N0V88_004628 [Collariella sp. IMI 366227]